MKRTSKIWLVLLLGVAAVGYARDWFVPSSSRHAEERKVDLKLTVDPDKVKEDAGKVKEKINELSDQVTNKG